MASSNLIPNCNITTHDVSNARKMFGTQLEGIRGKTTRNRPDPVVEQYVVAIPRDFVTQNNILMLTVDVFFVDGIAFLLTLSRQIQFFTVEHAPKRTAKQLVIHLKRVLQVYNRAGFTVRYVLMDREFEKVKNELPSVVINTTATKEHVSEAKRKIHVVTERARGILCTLPYQNIPSRMKFKILYFIVLWLNTFPVKNGVSAVFPQGY